MGDAVFGNVIDLLTCWIGGTHWTEGRETLVMRELVGACKLHPHAGLDEPSLEDL